jgi:hypothetical protein
MGRQAKPVTRREHTLTRVLTRWATGRHWHGRSMSDATFWADGTQGEPGWRGMGRESRWVLLAGWKRAGLRLAVVAAAAGLAHRPWRHVTEWVLALVLGPVLGLAAWRGMLTVRLWRHRATLERPMASALAPFLGVPPRTVEAGLAVEPGFVDVAGGEHVAAVELPDHWAATADQKARVQEVIAARLGVDLKYAWRTASYPMVLNVTRAPVPPSRVLLGDVLAELAAAPPHLVLLGRAPDGTMHTWDRSAEDPHIAIHGGSRRGKTSLLLSLAAQDLARGGQVVAIDPKRVSLMGLAGLPGVTLLNDPRDVHAMWDGIAGFRMEIEDRFEALAADPTLEFPRLTLLVDEVSMFAGMSAQLWRAEKSRSDPVQPPVWDDVAAGVWMGAQVHAHVVVAGQRLDFKILGGMLGSFGVRMLAGYGPQDFARLVGQPPYLRSQKPRGRFLLYEGGELTWLQLIFGEPEQWRAWVLDSRQGAPDLVADVEAATSDVIGLAAGAEYLGLSADAFRKRRERSGSVPGEFRVGNQPAWKRADLDRWAGRLGVDV